MPEANQPWLARFVRKDSYFSKYGRVKPKAFVETRPFKTSVYMHGVFRKDIDWDVGVHLYENHLKGAADISRRELEFQGMSAQHADADYKPDWHQDIHGMGADDDIAAKTLKAQGLADSAVFVRHPDDLNAPSPIVSFVVVLGEVDGHERLRVFCDQLCARADPHWECIIINDGNNKWAHPLNNRLANHNEKSGCYHFRWINQEQKLGPKRSFERGWSLALAKDIRDFDFTIVFSIIIPVYNVEKYLRLCLDSVLAQTVGDWEAICVDDGSTDGSGAILDEYAAKDNRFKVFHQKNGGEGAARNAALEVATGEWLVYLDSDDLLAPWTMETCRDLASRNPRVDLLRFGLTRYVDDPHWTKIPCSIDSTRVDDLSGHIFTSDVIGVNFPQFVYRRSVFGQLRFPSYCVGADRVYLAHCLILARTRVATSYTCYGYRIAQGSVSTSAQTFRKVRDLILHTIELLSIFQASGKKLERAALRVFTNEITEAAAYCIGQIVLSEERRNAWNVWQASIRRCESFNRLSAYRRLTLVLARLFPFRLVWKFVFAFPYWLKKKGVHR